MNNNDTKTMVTFAPISNWIPVADAKVMRSELVNNGTFAKDQVKLSSYRWVDTKDHSKGYLCRVLAIKGLRPDMEVETKRVKKAAAVTTSGNSDNAAINLTYWQPVSKVDTDTKTA